jgi:hypothetical protein
VPPVNEPIITNDLYVHSEDITFSKNNPAAGEEITIIANIHYWATSSTLLAKDIAVKFYVTYPGDSKMLVRQTFIDRISVASPDNGERYASASWKNTADGIYIVEVEALPLSPLSYTESNLLNNAATRAIIVGQPSGANGAVGGQVTDPWGGVAGVQLNLVDLGGMPVAQRFTDGTGGYLFEGVAPGSYSVQMVVPPHYTTLVNQKPATVTAKNVTAVNFQLAGATGAVDVQVTGPLGVGVAGVQLKLVGPNGFMEQNSTGDNGGYLFNEVAPGSYSVQIVVPPQYSTNVNEKPVTVTAKNVSTVDFQLVDANGAVGGRVTDSKGEGVKDVRLNLVDLNGAPLTQKFTDGTGEYLFEGVAPGNYSVQIVVPPQYNAVNAKPVTVMANIVSAVNFQLVDANGEVGGQVTGPLGGVAGVQLKLVGSNGSEKQTSTGTDGRYLFGEVAPGSYRVQIMAPPPYDTDWDELPVTVTAKNVSTVDFILLFRTQRVRSFRKWT